ncbi:MAG TPA: DUF1918 domain-containing protein [Acidimicrobiia bacterium]|nr:DUF1918 domain-containing protein [Acidimicrobiia bacterium]
MKARVGDRLVIKAHRVGEHDRDAEVLEVRGEDGGPPWLIRWEDSAHEVLFFPGPDARVEHYASAADRSAQRRPQVDLVAEALAPSVGQDSAVRRRPRRVSR